MYPSKHRVKESASFSLQDIWKKKYWHLRSDVFKGFGICNQSNGMAKLCVVHTNNTTDIRLWDVHVRYNGPHLFTEMFEQEMVQRHAADYLEIPEGRTVFNTIIFFLLLSVDFVAWQLNAVDVGSMMFLYHIERTIGFVLVPYITWHILFLKHWTMTNKAYDEICPTSRGDNALILVSSD